MNNLLKPKLIQCVDNCGCIRKSEVDYTINFGYGKEGEVCIISNLEEYTFSDEIYMECGNKFIGIDKYIERIEDEGELYVLPKHTNMSTVEDYKRIKTNIIFTKEKYAEMINDLYEDKAIVIEINGQKHITEIKNISNVYIADFK